MDIITFIELFICFLTLVILGNQLRRYLDGDLTIYEKEIVQDQICTVFNKYISNDMPVARERTIVYKITYLSKKG